MSWLQRTERWLCWLSPFSSMGVPKTADRQYSTTQQESFQCLFNRKQWIFTSNKAQSIKDILDIAGRRFKPRRASGYMCPRNKHVVYAQACTSLKTYFGVLMAETRLFSMGVAYVTSSSGLVYANCTVCQVAYEYIQTLTISKL